MKDKDVFNIITVTKRNQNTEMPTHYWHSISTENLTRKSLKNWDKDSINPYECN